VKREAVILQEAFFEPVMMVLGGMPFCRISKKCFMGKIVKLFFLGILSRVGILFPIALTPAETVVNLFLSLELKFPSCFWARRAMIFTWLADGCQIWLV